MTDVTNKATLRGSEVRDLESMSKAMSQKGWNNEPWQWTKLPDGGVEVTWQSKM
jgi:hypothetical protein